MPTEIEVHQLARKAVWKRVKAAPFRRGDLQLVAQTAGMGEAAAHRLAVKAINELKATGNIRFEGSSPKFGRWHYEARADDPPEPPPPPPPPPWSGWSGIPGGAEAVAERISARPKPGQEYDPPVALEGPNTGLSEAVAQKLWLLRQEAQGREIITTWEEPASAAVKASWRKTTLKLLDWLWRIGFTGPGGPPRAAAAGWRYAWNYPIGAWEIIDDNSGCVACVPNEEDVPLILAAPRMAFAIVSLLTELADHPARELPAIRALAETLKGVPLPAPFEVSLAETLARGVSCGVLTEADGRFGLAEWNIPEATDVP